MLNQIYVAPQHVSPQVAPEHDDPLAFASRNYLGFEIPDFKYVQHLTGDNRDVVSKWHDIHKQAHCPLALHGPVDDLNPISRDPEIARISRLRYAKALEIAKLLGVHYMVYHTQYSPVTRISKTHGDWVKRNAEFWHELAEEHLSEFPNVTIVLENFLEESPDLMRELADAIHHPQVQLCLDMGHANITSDRTMSDWIQTLDHQLVYVQAHNNYGQTDDHLSFEDGTLDYQYIISELSQSANQYDISLEMPNFVDIRSSYQLLEVYKSRQQMSQREVSFLI